jgi:simple sugar transport system ATP-binding protein
MHSTQLDRKALEEAIPRKIDTSIEFALITKKFGDLTANDSISCSFTAGGVHALLGENGAGKSTLMKILCGHYKPDSGKILIDGRQANFSSTYQARRMGIGMVHQQFTLVPSMTVLENILLGDSEVPLVIDKKAQSKRFLSLAAKLGMHLDPDKPVANLSIAERQKVEIAKLLWRDARILILDEPTSQLAGFEAEDILTTAQELANNGKIVILISHHIEEILRFSRRITVLRGGKHVATLETRNVQADELARLMVDTVNVGTMDTTNRMCSDPYISMRQVVVPPTSTNRRIHSFDMDLYAGEILGIAGVVGGGQEEVASILTGHLRPQSGTLRVNGQFSSWSKLRDTKLTGGYIPPDPRLSTIPNMSALENSMLRDLHSKDFVSGPFLKRQLIRETAVKRIERFSVEPSHPDTLASSYSGGNLQRLVLSRELDNPQMLLVAVNPTAGLDIAMTQRVLLEMRAQASAGKAVIIVSPDLGELLSICDRILVMCQGTVVGTERVEDLDQESLGLLIGGVNFAIARQLARHMRSESDEVIGTEIRQTLFALLRSKHNWQRRIACHIAYRTFTKVDLEFAKELLLHEENAECRAWLQIISAKHSVPDASQNLRAEIASSAAPYMAVAKKIWGCQNESELASKLMSLLSSRVQTFETTLAGFVLELLFEDSMPIRTMSKQLILESRS